MVLREMLEEGHRSPAEAREVSARQEQQLREIRDFFLGLLYKRGTEKKPSKLGKLVVRLLQKIDPEVLPLRKTELALKGRIPDFHEEVEVEVYANGFRPELTRNFELPIYVNVRTEGEENNYKLRQDIGRSLFQQNKDLNTERGFESCLGLVLVVDAIEHNDLQVQT